VKYLPSGILKEHSTGLLRSKGFAFISQGQLADRNYSVHFQWLKKDMFT